MAAKIHSTAIVDKKARIADGVEIGPYCLIGPEVTIGTGTRLLGHVVVEGHTQIGERCSIFYGACMGTAPQDKKYKGEISYLTIGDDNVIREYVTINLGASLGSKTVIGNKNFLMAASHVGHDCVIGDEVVIVNGVGVGGHVTLENNVVVGGYSGIHQFCRVGKFAMVGGFSKVVMDVPPFSMCDGNPAVIKGINSVGLKRAGFQSSQAMKLKKAIKILFMSGRTLTHALEQLPLEVEMDDLLKGLVEFTRNSKRGITRQSADKSESEAID